MVELLSFLLFSGWAAVRESEGSAGRSSFVPQGPPLSGGTGLSEDLAITQAKDEFLPYTADQIEAIQRAHPEATTWKTISGYMPYLTEAVAMYYVMWDPKVPVAIKLEVAAALLYAISPVDLIPDEAVPVAGWFDDAVFLAGVLYQVWGYITKKHVRQAQDWLLEHGIEPTPLFAIGKQFQELPESVPATSHKPSAISSPRYGADPFPGLVVADEQGRAKPSGRDTNLTLSLARCIWSSWPRPPSGRRPSVSAGHDPRNGQMHVTLSTDDPDWYLERDFPSEMDGVKIYYRRSTV